MGGDALTPGRRRCPRPPARPLARPPAREGAGSALGALTRSQQRPWDWLCYLCPVGQAHSPPPQEPPASCQPRHPPCYCPPPWPATQWLLCWKGEQMQSVSV